MASLWSHLCHNRLVGLIWSILTWDHLNIVSTPWFLKKPFLCDMTKHTWRIPTRFLCSIIISEIDLSRDWDLLILKKLQPYLLLQNHNQRTKYYLQLDLNFLKDLMVCHITLCYLSSLLTTVETWTDFFLGYNRCSLENNIYENI